MITCITLGNNYFAVWDISPDSTLLGVTDTRMSGHFAESGLVFPQFWVFESIFELYLQKINFFFTSFAPFIVLKTTVSISRFQRKNRFEKRATLG